MKKLGFLLVLFSLVGASCSFTMPEQEDQVISTEKQASFVVETISIDEDTDAFFFSIEYPKFENAQLSQLAEEVVLAKRAAFEADVKENGEMDPDLFGEQKNGFWAEYTIDRLNDSVKTITYTISTYYAGAAHPNTDIKTITYDLTNDKELVFKDVFLLEKDALFALSDKVKMELYRQSAELAVQNGFEPIQSPNDELIEEGAGPFPENFEQFILQEDAVVFLFPPYQVGVYVEGVKEVVIPYEEIQELLISFS